MGQWLRFYSDAIKEHCKEMLHPTGNILWIDSTYFDLEILERKAYLLSRAVLTVWNDLHGANSHLISGLINGTYDEMNLSLGRLREFAEIDFEKCAERYRRLTNFKPPTS